MDHEIESTIETSPDYRALYEQEKVLREAAEAIIVESGIVAETQRLKEAHKHYQQLKQQYNGK